MVLCLSGLSWACPAWAALPEDLAACRALADNARRLACYDALSPAVTGSFGLPKPAAAPSAVAAAPAAEAAADGVTVRSPAPSAPAAGYEKSFGAETVRSADDRANLSLSAHVVGDIDGLRRGAVLHLDNGQIWRSVDDREYPYEGTNPAVTIQRNMVGSYWMHIENSAFNLRVSRVE